MSELKKPILYKANLSLRFSDFDSYGHLNSSKYVDLVIASRFSFQSNVLKMPPSEFVKRNIGFYLAKFEISFKKPVSMDQGELHIRSWISEINGHRVPAQFEVCDAKGEVVHATGIFHFVSINLQEQKPQPVPEWVLPYIFEKE